jgi:hypothetical protein
MVNRHYEIGCRQDNLVRARAQLRDADLVLEESISLALRGAELPFKELHVEQHYRPCRASRF